MSRPRLNPDDALLQALRHGRPWRKLGAAICAVAGVMFVCGIVYLPQSPAPLPFLLYWLIVVGMLGWVCVLAVKDVRHTLRLIREHQQMVDSAVRNAQGEDRDV